MTREKLVDEAPSNVERIRDLASILLRIGNMELQLGHRESAKAAYVRSLEWRKRWLELEPTNSDAALWLARNYRAIGDAEYSPENGDEARSWYLKAQHALDSRSLAQADAEVQHERIRLQHRFGRHEANRGEQVSALRHFLACKDVTDATLLADPEDLRAKEDRWLCGDEATRTLALLGRYEEALEHAEENLALAKDVNRRGSAKKNLLQIIAFSHGRLGQVLFETGDLPNALDNFKRSSEILESLNASDGDTLSSKHSLTDVYHRLAVTCIAMAESGCTEEDLQSEARTYVTKGLSVLASLPTDGEKRRHVEWSGELECKLAEVASKLDEELSVGVR
jgi:tetratricopeptide (TPR) repeat protein